MSKYKIEVKWAFVFIGLLLLWMILERVSGLHDVYIDKHAYLTNLFSLPAIVVYVLLMRDKKRNFYHGNMTYLQGFMSGLIATLIITVFSPLTQWIVSEVITPNYFANAIKYTVEAGYQTQTEAEAYFNYRNYVVQSTVGALIMGVITSAIVAIFMKSRER